MQEKQQEKRLTVGGGFTVVEEEEARPTTVVGHQTADKAQAKRAWRAGATRRGECGAA